MLDANAVCDKRHNSLLARLRARIVEAVTDGDLAAVVRALVQAAKAGEPWAVRELLDRCIGKARTASDDTGEPLDVVRFVVTLPGVEQARHARLPR